MQWLTEKKKIIEFNRKNDWRLNYIKYDKFGRTISSCSAIKILENSQTKKGPFFNLQLPGAKHRRGNIFMPWCHSSNSIYEVLLLIC